MADASSCDRLCGINRSVQYVFDYRTNVGSHCQPYSQVSVYSFASKMSLESISSGASSSQSKEKSESLFFWRFKINPRSQVVFAVIRRICDYGANGRPPHHCLSARAKQESWRSQIACHYLVEQENNLAVQAK